MISTALDQVIVNAGLIDQQQQQPAGHGQGRAGAKPGQAVNGTVSQHLRSTLGVTSIDLSEVSVERSVLELIPSQTARRYKLLPVRRSGRKLTVAMAEPSNVFAQDDITFMTGCAVEPVAATELAIEAAISRCYHDGGETTSGPGDVGPCPATGSSCPATGKKPNGRSEDGGNGPVAPDVDPQLDIAELDSLAQGAVDAAVVLEDKGSDLFRTEVDAPIIKLVNGILLNAHRMRASDVHIEPFERLLRVRYRLDGICKTVMSLPPSIRNPVVSRIKVMAKLDIAERRLPQDGRIKHRLGHGAEVDLRVSVLPGIFGEKVVLRLLDRSALHLDMEALGFERSALQQFKAAIHRPNGMVLVTGPTGSGKTTTLYSALADLNSEEVNIVTVEDPVEYNMVGITQVEVKERIGLDFASSLRSFLRQDPDIMLIGEVRDHETAKIAVKAALTGHLVLSTLHTNDAATAITRLIDMGMEPFLVAYSLQLVVAQRLVRRICEHCREAVEHPAQMLMEIGVGRQEAAKLCCYRGQGCVACRGTGYRGRVALFEVLPVTDEIRQLILSGDTGLAIKQSALKNGATALRTCGLRQVAKGVTTIEEVLRVTC